MITKLKGFVAVVLLNIILISGCKNISEKNIKKNINLDTFHQVFTIVDSLLMKYPEEFVPLAIYDITINDSSIYISGKCKKYPVIEFDKKGNFLSTVGDDRDGYTFKDGYKLKWAPKRISCNNKYLAACWPSISRIHIYKNDQLFKDITNRKYRQMDIMMMKRNLLVVNGYSSDDYLLLYDEDFKLIDKKLKFPDKSFFTDYTLTPYWGAQTSEAGIIVNKIYPVYIKRIKIVTNKILLIEDVNLKKFENFQVVRDTTINKYNFKEKIKNIYEFYSIEFDKMLWIINNGDYYIGAYIHLTDIGQKFKVRDYRIFIAKDTELILDFSHHALKYPTPARPEHYFKDFIIPSDYDDRFINFKVKYKGDKRYVMLYFFTLNKKYLDTLQIL